MTLDVDEVAEHANGLVLTLNRSKTDRTGEQPELLVLPRAGNPDRRPVTALQTWTDLAGITTGPLFRAVAKSNRASDRALHPESVNDLVPAALARRASRWVQRAQPARRVRHLRLPARRLRPSHRPLDPASVSGQPRRVRPRARLD